MSNCMYHFFKYWRDASEFVQNNVNAKIVASIPKIAVFIPKELQNHGRN